MDKRIPRFVCQEYTLENQARSGKSTSTPISIQLISLVDARLLESVDFLLPGLVPGVRLNTHSQQAKNKLELQTTTFVNWYLGQQ